MPPLNFTTEELAALRQRASRWPTGGTPSFCARSGLNWRPGDKLARLASASSKIASVQRRFVLDPQRVVRERETPRPGGRRMAPDTNGFSG